MILFKQNVGALGTNCYIVGDKDEAIVIDPGANAEKIYDLILNNGVTVKYIVLTHCHFDHILATSELQKLTNAKIIISKSEEKNLKSNEINMTGRFMSKSEQASKIVPDVLVSENDVIESGKYKFMVIETPGHTSGGICLYEESEKMLFAGDTLFFQSIGRTDFPTGDFNTLIDSIKNKLFLLPDETKVFPGHECETTILNEKQNNPFIN